MTKQTTRFSSAVRTNIAPGWLHMNGWKMAADVRIVKLRLGGRAEELAIDLGRHIAVTIDGAVDELDFEGVESLTITDSRQCMRMDGLTCDSRSDLALFRGARAPER
jgi:hypothetical protein